MLPGTARVMKWLPAHLAAKRLPQSVMADILTTNLHTEALTGCIYHLILAKARIHARKCPLSIPIFLLENEEMIMLTLLRGLYELVVTKPVFRVFDKAGLKPVSSVTGTS